VPPESPRRRLRRRRIALGALCLAAAWTAGVSSASATADPGARMGAFRGASNVAGIDQFESWTGRPAYRVLDFLADDDWSKISAPWWWADNWAASPYRDRMVYSVPILVDTGGTLAEGAGGAYNDHYASLARVLVARGQANVTLRLGWEFNGDWYRWRIDVPNGARDYAAYYRQIVRTMRSVPGANFRFDWCTNNGNGGSAWNVDPEPAYPGDDYVDFISQDVYDRSWPATSDPASRWATIRSRPYGLDWLSAFAAAHDKPIGLPEWGLGYDANGGGDDPYFIRKMYDWIGSHRVAYHDYWEYSAQPRLMTGVNPRSATAFRATFGTRRSSR
jgi:hypothetical protein